MGVSTREKGLLKLVHPGRHVEVYREPVVAAEVMKKYPRHCITRPDVFKFPWVVVKPEAVLLPGKVFYVVPYRTVYQLLKDRRQRNQHTPRHNHSENNVQEQPDFSSDNYFPSYNLINGESHHRLDPSLPHKKKEPLNNQESHHSSSLTSLSRKEHPLKIGENHSFLCQETRIRSSAGRTPKHIHGRLQSSPWYRPRNEEELSQSPDRPVYYSPSTEVASSSSKKMKGYQNALLVSSDDRSLDRSYSYSGRLNISRLGISSRVHEADHHTRGSTSTRVQLKSCLRKPGSAQRRLNLRVTFASSVFIPSRDRDSPTLQHDFAEF